MTALSDIKAALFAQGLICPEQPEYIGLNPDLKDWTLTLGISAARAVAVECDRVTPATICGVKVVTTQRFPGWELEKRG